MRTNLPRIIPIEAGCDVGTVRFVRKEASDPSEVVCADPILEALVGHGLSAADLAEISTIIAANQKIDAMRLAADLLRRIFLRVEADSIAGAALVLALGFERGRSIEDLAKAHGTSRQNLHSQRCRLQIALGSELTLLTRQAEEPADLVADTIEDEPVDDEQVIEDHSPQTIAQLADSFGDTEDDSDDPHPGNGSFP